MKISSQSFGKLLYATVITSLLISIPVTSHANYQCNGGSGGCECTEGGSGSTGFESGNPDKSCEYLGVQTHCIAKPVYLPV